VTQVRNDVQGLHRIQLYGRKIVAVRAHLDHDSQIFQRGNELPGTSARIRSPATESPSSSSRISASRPSFSSALFGRPRALKSKT